MEHKGRDRRYLHAVRIRPVEPGDTEAVGDVFLAALAGMTYLPDLHTEEETRDFIRNVLLPNNEVWVAEEDGRVIGFTGLGDDFVRHLWVLPEEQNRGVGTALLDAGEGAPTRGAAALGVPAERRRAPLLRAARVHPREADGRERQRGA